MKLFEIHITGKNKDILNYLRENQLKGIEIELLDSNFNYMRTEYMSSLEKKFEDYDTCKQWVDELTQDMTSNMIDIIRVKIECPYYPEYVGNSLYIESHWRITTTDEKAIYPVSKNAISNKYLATNRIYDKENYINFVQQEKGRQVELCMYDTFINEDIDWFKAYSNN